MKPKVLDSLHRQIQNTDIFVHSSGLVDEIRENDEVDVR